MFCYIRLNELLRYVLSLSATYYFDDTCVGLVFY